VRAERETQFWAKVSKAGSVDCWVWRAARIPDGYGQFGNGDDPSRSTLAHRVAYELLVGPIPEGLVIDHLCRNRPCVNPAHLEPVTRRENTMRSAIVPQVAVLSETHCKRGHPLDGVQHNGNRRCSTCQRTAMREYQQRRRARLRASQAVS
jgi:hypothetical protein